jgi:hypothetical protein
VLNLASLADEASIGDRRADSNMLRRSESPGKSKVVENEFGSGVFPIGAKTYYCASAA